MKYALTDQDQQELDKRFTYHAPKDDQPGRYNVLRSNGRRMAESIMEMVPPSRERSVALTQLEDALMWANAGIARNE